MYSTPKNPMKWARLQSGWQRTEKEKGVYDFKWLDGIVDKMLEIGVEPWLCLCYGNSLYTDSAKKVFGAVGCPPIKTEEERKAWRYGMSLMENGAGSTDLMPKNSVSLLLIPPRLVKIPIRIVRLSALPHAI